MKEKEAADKSKTFSPKSFIGVVAQHPINSIQQIPNQSQLNISTFKSPLKCSSCTKVFVYKENFAKHVAKCGKPIGEPAKKKKKSSKSGSVVGASPRDSRSVTKIKNQQGDRSTTTDNTVTKTHVVLKNFIYLVFHLICRTTY